MHEQFLTNSRGRFRSKAEFIIFVSVCIFVLDTVRTRSALCKTQLKMITNTHKKHIVCLSCLSENVLQTVSLVRSETTANAVLILTAALQYLVTLQANVFLREA